MANPLGGILSQRPTEGYSKSIQGSDPIALDSAGNPIVAEVGDAYANAIRVGGGWMRMTALLLLYIASGGMGSGQSPIEFLSAAGMELDPSMLTLDGEPGGLFNPPH